jgi:putative SOS response-associated peptidase YedK
MSSSTQQTIYPSGQGAGQGNAIPMSGLHDRPTSLLQPCMERETWATWLGEEPADPRQLKALLAPYPSEGMTCWPVSPRVGNVKNNNASLVEPIGFRA